MPAEVSSTGLEVVDLFTDPSFIARQNRPRARTPHLEGLRRLAHAFVEHPNSLLQELADCAVELCGADSAGISLQSVSETGEVTYHWVATAGAYKRFLNAVLPAFPSACGLCLERDRPQRFRVHQSFFDELQLEGDPVTDGLLFPWGVDEIRGTVWVLAHGRTNAFDTADAETMELLADFAAITARQQAQRKLLLRRATDKAAATMANDLAHQINNPLQSLTNLVYLAANDEAGTDTRALARQMADDLRRLSELVGRLLALPNDNARSDQR